MIDADPELTKFAASLAPPPLEVMVERILAAWEYQARERDARDPMRLQIMQEAAAIRTLIANQAAEVTRLTEALATVTAERDEAIAEAHATGEERATWKSRAEAAEAALATARAEGVEAGLLNVLDNLLDAITATDRFGDRCLTITGPTANLKWLLEAEEAARAALIPAPPVDANATSPSRVDASTGPDAGDKRDEWQPITYSLHFSGSGGEVNNCEAVITGRPREGGEG